MAEQTGKFSSQISPNWLAQIIRPFLRHTSETWLDGAAAECASLILFELDNQPEPDWADLREMARNAGWSGRGGARWVMWGVWSGEDVADEHGWVIYHRFMESTQVTIVGPGSGHMGSRSHAELKDPTPAQVLTVVRQLGIGAS